jgi:Cu2+-exporting ATPase
MGGSCFHCGEALPATGVRFVAVQGRQQPMCCPGCEAAALLIQGAGLADYYRFRSTSSSRPESDAGEWAAYDRAEAQRELVTALPDGGCEAMFAVAGLRCAACAWLIERALGDVPGVQSARVNPATGRLQLRWRPAQARLGALLQRLAQLGYRPQPLDAAGHGSAWLAERRTALKRLAVAGLGMMQVMMNAVAVYIGNAQDMTGDFRGFLNATSLLITVPVLFYAARPFFDGAWRSLAARRPGMDLPVALALLIAFTASVWNTLTGEGLAGAGEVYFDSVAMFTFFLLLGRYAEMQARHRAAGIADALARALPATVQRERDGARETVARHELSPGDVVWVPAGGAVPADGLILDGRTRVDESLLTGESQPAVRGPGDALAAGSINVGQPLRLSVTRCGAATRLSHIARLLLRAQSERPVLAQQADRIASGFVSAVLLAAVATFAAWWHWQPAGAFAATLAVLVVSCPCALSLATPVALTAASNRLARLGLLTTRTDALEVLTRASDIVLDKTGTLTTGRSALLSVEALGNLPAAECESLAAALEQHSEHPIARAFAGRPFRHRAGNVHIHKGEGVEGRVDGRRLRIGRATFAAALSGRAQADTAGICLGDEQGLLARFELGDPQRPGAAAVVGELARAGLLVHIASGDAAPAVARAARDFGIGDWHARMTPEDKLAFIRALQRQGRVVAVVGDGINDAPVLAGADVSIALDSGSALAQSSADFVLLGDSLAPVMAGFETARRTRAVVRQNLGWALAYNLTALPFAALGFVPPWLAAIGMSASSLLVVANAMRLSRVRTTAAASPCARLEVHAA